MKFPIKIGISILVILSIFVIMVLGAIESVTINSPSNATNTSDATPEITFTVVGNESSWTVKIYQETSPGSGSYANTQNVTATNNTLTYANLTALLNGTSLFYLEANGTAGVPWRNSTVLTITVDTIVPNVTSYARQNVTNPTGENMTALVNFTVADNITHVSCIVKIKQTGQSDVVFGSDSITMNASGLSRRCVLTINPVNVTTEGNFYIEATANDSAGNTYATNDTNWTKITLLEDKWTLMRVLRNITLIEIGNFSYHITQVAFWSNEDKNYTTWTKGTATHANVQVNDTTAVYVYSNKTVGLLRYWTTDVQNKNFTLYNGWNQVATFNTTALKLEEACNLTLSNATADTLYISVPLANESKYYSHRCGFSFHSQIEIPIGHGYWMNVENQTGMYIDR